MTRLRFLDLSRSLDKCLKTPSTEIFKTLMRFKEEAGPLLYKTYEGPVRGVLTGLHTGPLLSIAAGNGWLEMCRYLVLELGAPVDGLPSETIYGWKATQWPLSKACSSDCPNAVVIEFLLDAGAKTIDNAIHDACEQGRLGITRLLLHKWKEVDALSGAVDSSDFCYSTACSLAKQHYRGKCPGLLVKAMLLEHEDLIRLLVENGAPRPSREFAMDKVKDEGMAGMYDFLDKVVAAEEQKNSKQ
jgi:hypothetical protein